MAADNEEETANLAFLETGGYGLLPPLPPAAELTAPLLFAGGGAEKANAEPAGCPHCAARLLESRYAARKPTSNLPTPVMHRICDHILSRPPGIHFVVVQVASQQFACDSRREASERDPSRVLEQQGEHFSASDPQISLVFLGLLITVQMTVRLRRTRLLQVLLRILPLASTPGGASAKEWLQAR